jgi:hypothetical protein
VVLVTIWSGVDVSLDFENNFLSVNFCSILVALITFGINPIWKRWKTVATSLRQLASKRVNRISSCLALIFVGLLRLHLYELVDIGLFCVCLF